LVGDGRRKSGEQQDKRASLLQRLMFLLLVGTTASQHRGKKNPSKIKLLRKQNPSQN
jgi:hypothetical protein